MIRREPTMIPMSDSDVQDVRDLVAGQMADYEKTQQILNKMKAMAERPPGDEDVPAFLQQKDRSEKDKRLGIQPGTSASVSANNANCTLVDKTRG